MKKVLSKIIILIVIVQLLLDFCGPTIPVSYADTGVDSFGDVMVIVTNLYGGLVSIIYWLPKLIYTGEIWLFNGLFVNNLAGSAGINSGFSKTVSMTPFDIFFNKFKLLDVNYFKFASTGGEPNDIMKRSVAEWYYVMRTLAAAILLIMFIYVGIRMAISTIAEDKAKYKQMLVDWLSSLALLFVLHYVIIFTIYINNAIVNFLKAAVSSSNMDDVIGKIRNKAMFGIGIPSMMSFLVYIMITFQTIFFLIAYIKRFLKVGFLIVISPLITITYSLDKMGDGKAQALNKWFKEFVYTILIQPFHCIMYIAFVNTAMELLVGSSDSLASAFGSEYNQVTNGVFAILCMKFINDGEKIIRKIFHFEDDSSLTSMAAGAAAGMMVANNAKKIGGAANSMKNTAGKIANSKHLKGATTAIKNKYDGSLLKKGIDGVKKVDDLRNKIPNSELGKKLKLDKVHKALKLDTDPGKVVAGMVAGMAAYSAGGTTAVGAVGIGAAAMKSVDEINNKKTANVAGGEKNNAKTVFNNAAETAQKGFEEMLPEMAAESQAISDVVDQATQDGSDDVLTQKMDDAIESQDSAYDQEIEGYNNEIGNVKAAIAADEDAAEAGDPDAQQRVEENKNKLAELEAKKTVAVGKQKRLREFKKNFKRARMAKEDPEAFNRMVFDETVANPPNDDYIKDLETELIQLVLAFNAAPKIGNNGPVLDKTNLPPISDYSSDEVREAQSVVNFLKLGTQRQVLMDVSSAEMTQNRESMLKANAATYSNGNEGPQIQGLYQDINDTMGQMEVALRQRELAAAVQQNRTNRDAENENDVDRADNAFYSNL